MSSAEGVRYRNVLEIEIIHHLLLFRCRTQQIDSLHGSFHNIALLIIFKKIYAEKERKREGGKRGAKNVKKHVTIHNYVEL